jgi:hypothetical protein
LLFLPATQEKKLIEEHGEINPEKSLLFLPATQAATQERS